MKIRWLFSLLSSFFAISAVAQIAENFVYPKHEVRWTPVKNQLPIRYVLNARVLLSHGLSDPREAGELSIVNVPTKWPGSRTKVREEFGWPLAGNKRAVLINGLTEDIEGVVRTASVSEMVQHFERRGFGPSLFGSQAAVPALLLLRGDAVAAKKFYDDCVVQPLELPGFLIRQHFSRAYAALRSDNDAAVVAALDEAEYIQDLSNIHLLYPNERPVLPGLGTLLWVREQAAERIATGRQRPNLAALAKLPAKERIAVLVENLDYCRGSVLSGVSSDDPGLDPILKALLAEGQSIVEPLLWAYQSDARMTGILSPSMNPQLAPRMVMVRELVVLLLRQVWPTGMIRFTRGQSTADDLLAQWEVQKLLSPGGQELAALQDIIATPASDLVILRRITEQRTPGSKPKVASWPQGEREELGRLLAQRIRESLPVESKTHPRGHSGKVNHVFELSVLMAKIDLKLTRAIVKEISPTIIEFVKRSGFTGSINVSAYADYLALKVKLSEPGVLDEFRQLLGSIKKGESAFAQVYAPLLASLSGGKEWAKFRAEFFATWEQEVREPSYVTAVPLQGKVTIWQSGFLSLPEYRRFAVTSLSVSRVYGTLGVREGSRQHNVRVANPLDGASTLLTLATLPTNRIISVGDYVAWNISKVAGCPPFDFAWTQEERDQARTKISDWLRRTEVDWSSIGERRPGL